MAHGLLIYGDFAQIGGTLFDFAAERDEGVVIFAESKWSDPDYGYSEHWKESLVRPITGPVDDLGQCDYSRYHPAWSRPFSRMCDDCSLRISHGIAVPYESEDSEANRMGPQLHAIAMKVVPILPSGKRIGRFFLPLQVKPWLMAFGYTYESCAPIFLGDDAGLVDEFSIRLQASVNRVRIQESW